MRDLIRRLEEAQGGKEVLATAAGKEFLQKAQAVHDAIGKLRVLVWELGLRERIDKGLWRDIDGMMRVLHTADRELAKLL